MQVRQPAGVRSLAERRKFGRSHHGPCLVRRAQVRSNNAERAAFEHARDVLRRVGGNAHERRDPDFERRYADLAASIEREARMFEVDIERVEAGGARDAGDLDGAHEPHRHRRDHLVPRQLLFDVVAQDFAYRHVAPPLALSLALSCHPSLGLGHAAALCCPRRQRKATETIHELHHGVQVDPRASLSRGMANAR